VRESPSSHPFPCPRALGVVESVGDVVIAGILEELRMCAVLKVDPPPGLRLSAAAVGVVWSGLVWYSLLDRRNGGGGY